MHGGCYWELLRLLALTAGSPKPIQKSQWPGAEHKHHEYEDEEYDEPNPPRAGDWAEGQCFNVRELVF